MWFVLSPGLAPLLTRARRRVAVESCSRGRARAGHPWRAGLWAAWLWLLLAAVLSGLLRPLPAQAHDARLMRDAAQRLGRGAPAAVPALLALLAEAKGMDELHRLVAVNRHINSVVQFKPDTEVWGELDHWASPLQTLAAGAGDCEDFVIAKYALLLAAGLPMDKLRLVYVRAQLPDQATPLAHMVLAYYAAPGAEPMILDNLRLEVQPASQRPDLAPVFSFNSAGLWQGVAGAPAGDPMVRLSRWRDTWRRTLQEGLP